MGPLVPGRRLQPPEAKVGWLVSTVVLCIGQVDFLEEMRRCMGGVGLACAQWCRGCCRLYFVDISYTGQIDVSMCKQVQMVRTALIRTARARRLMTMTP